MIEETQLAPLFTFILKNTKFPRRAEINTN